MTLGNKCHNNQGMVVLWHIYSPCHEIIYKNIYVVRHSIYLCVTIYTKDCQQIIKV